MTRTIRVALAVSVFFLLCGTMFAQDWRWQRDRDRDDGYHGQQNKDYDHGFRDGRNDRAHNERYHPRHTSNSSYMNGYRAGYGDFDRRHDRDRDDRRNDHDRDDRRNDHDADDARRNGPYRGPNVPYGQQNIQQVGYNNGYQEGLRYGQADRNNGHSNRPDHSSTYQNGSSGYNPSYGDKMTYKRAFQQGFRAGYDRGYNGRR